MLPAFSPRLRLGPGLLFDRQQAIFRHGLAHQWAMCEKTGRMENLRRAARGERGGFVGRYYDDSDVHKLAEATLYAVAYHPELPVRAKLDEYVEVVHAAQAPDGYLNSYFQLMHPDLRYRALSSMHEIYCMGHLLEACAAAAEAEIYPQLVQVGQRLTDHLVREFGAEGRPGYCGHQQAEIALARFGRAVNREDALDLSRRMTDFRGVRPTPLEIEFTDETARTLAPWMRAHVGIHGEYDGSYYQDDQPLRDQTTAVGHSVRAMYQFCGALDGYGDSDATLMSALLTIWREMTEKRLYVIGGIGSARRNEGFTVDYDLPSETAYCETCAAVALCMWAARMGLLGVEGAWRVFERALFNNVLAGFNDDATLYNYDNPLEHDGRHVRKPWFECACCPPNVARFLGSITRYLAHPVQGRAQVEVPAALEGELTHPFGEKLVVKIESDYPFGSEIRIETRGSLPLAVMVDRWTAEPRAERVIGSASFSTALRQGWVRAHGSVRDTAGKVAFQRGPVVYALEGRDVEPPIPLNELCIDPEAPVYVQDSGRSIAVTAHRRHPAGEELYDFNRMVEEQELELTLRPFAANGNRGRRPLTVWLRER